MNSKLKAFAAEDVQGLRVCLGLRVKGLGGLGFRI